MKIPSFVSRDGVCSSWPRETVLFTTRQQGAINTIAFRQLAAYPSGVVYEEFTVFRLQTIYLVVVE